MKKLIILILPVMTLLFASSVAGRADEFSQIANGSDGYWVPSPTPPPPVVYYGAGPTYYDYGPYPYYGPGPYFGPSFLFGFGFGGHGGGGWHGGGGGGGGGHWHH